MDFQLTDIQTDIKRVAREFAEGEFPKIAQECDRAEKSDAGLMQKARELGFCGVFIDEEYGGWAWIFRNRPRDGGILAVDPGLGNAITCMSFGSEMLLLFGTEAQKERYLTSVCRGTKIGAVAATEPDAGSDILAVATRAVRKDEGYLINGSKMFISNGDIADFFVTLCLTNPESRVEDGPPQRHRDRRRSTGHRAKQAAGEAGHPGPRHRRDYLQQRMGAGGEPDR